MMRRQEPLHTIILETHTGHGYGAEFYGPVRTTKEAAVIARRLINEKRLIFIDVIEVKGESRRLVCEIETPTHDDDYFDEQCQINDAAFARLDQWDEG